MIRCALALLFLFASCGDSARDSSPGAAPGPDESGATPPPGSRSNAGPTPGPTPSGDPIPPPADDAGAAAAKGPSPADAAADRGADSKPVDAKPAATPDGGPPPTTNVGGPSLCGQSTFLLCDGFETGAIDRARWTPRTKNGGTVGVDAVRAARGGFAMHAHTAGLDTSVGMLRAVLRGASKNAFFGRAFFYFQGTPPAANYDYVSAQGSPPGTTEYGSYNFGGTTSRTTGIREVLSIIHPGHTGIGSSFPMPPTDRWACWEWEMRGDTQVLRVWINGQQVPFRMPPVGMVFSVLDIGMVNFHADKTPAFDLWVDEIAVDSTRIGCDR